MRKEINYELKLNSASVAGMTPYWRHIRRRRRTERVRTVKETVVATPDNASGARNPR